MLRFSLLALIATLSGCADRTPLPFPQFMSETAGTAAPDNPQDAYFVYTGAAIKVDEATESNRGLRTRTSYSPGQRQELQKACEPAIRGLQSASGRSCHVLYARPGSQDAMMYRLEWRLLGRVLVWDIEDAIARKDVDSAIAEETLLTKFGFDLTSGSPSDVSLGFVMVDQGRRAILPAVGQMSPIKLRNLAKALKTVYLDRPSLEGAAKSAGKEMLQAVQDVQDAYRKQDYASIDRALGPEFKDAVDFLQGLHDQPDQKRAEYFEGFADDARAESDQLEREVSMSEAERQSEVTNASANRKPWKRLARRFFDIGRPMLAMNDATCARTEMLILTCAIESQLKTSGKPPPSLGGFTPALTRDPYSGQPLVYRTAGRDYRLYSVGEDLVDNNGDSDEGFSKPDLVLERSPG